MNAYDSIPVPYRILNNIHSHVFCQKVISKSISTGCVHIIKESVIPFLALKKSPFASRIKISEEDAGLHFLMYVDTVLTDEALLEKAGKQGLHLACLSQYYASGSSQIPAHTLVLNYSALTQDSVSQAIKLLSRILC